MMTPSRRDSANRRSGFPRWTERRATVSILTAQFKNGMFRLYRRGPPDLFIEIADMFGPVGHFPFPD